MAILDMQAAIDFFEGLPSSLQISYLHPRYVFADATREKELEPIFFTYQRGSSYFYHAFHIQPIEGTSFIDIQSPYGYGGPVLASNCDSFLSQAWCEYDKWCEAQNVLVEFIRFYPLLHNWQYFVGDVLNNRETVWMDLQHKDIIAQCSSRMRTSIRKGYRQGLQVDWLKPQKGISTFYSIYTAAMEALEADKFYFFPKYYFKELAQTNLIWLGVCLKDSCPIASAIFLIGAHTCEYHLGASNEEGKRYGAMKMLFYEAALKAKSFGLKRLCLGGGSDVSPTNTLLMYKKKFSSYTAEFKIGKRVHRNADYSQLKDTWENQTKRSSEKILFYR